LVELKRGLGDQGQFVASFDTSVREVDTSIISSDKHLSLYDPPSFRSLPNRHSQSAHPHSFHNTARQHSRLDMLSFSILPLLALSALKVPVSLAAPTNTTGHCRSRHRHHHNGTTTTTGLVGVGGEDKASLTLTTTISTSDIVPTTTITDITTTESAISLSVTEVSATATTEEATTTQDSTDPSVPSPISSAPPGTITAGSADADGLVKLHSDFRAQYGKSLLLSVSEVISYKLLGAGPVVWNNELAEFAQNAANTCNYSHTYVPFHPVPVHS
jgi:hypothetical protein